jgi:excinuclease ABC subunit C
MGSADIPAARSAAVLPLTPGVYRFRDQAGRVLYIGRAVSLRRRVLPLGHAADHQAGTGRELALVRGVSPGARTGLARDIAAVLDQAAVAALRAGLTARRDAAATALAFEFAAKLQAELEAVDWITAEQKVTGDQRDLPDADVFGWAGGVLVGFEIRGGRMSGWRQRPCPAATARRYLERSPPGWTAFARRSAELAATLRPDPRPSCAG